MLCRSVQTCYKNQQLTEFEAARFRKRGTNPRLKEGSLHTVGVNHAQHLPAGEIQTTLSQTPNL